MSEEIRCCRNCGNLIDYPTGNKYGDVHHFCLVTGYYVTSIDKDSTKVKRFTPGGKELHCLWKEKRVPS